MDLQEAKNEILFALCLHFKSILFSKMSMQCFLFRKVCCGFHPVLDKK